jgi:Flp pilus assembly pilin Flp
MRRRIAQLVVRLRREQQGLTTVEYAIVLCLIAALSVGAWNAFGKNVKTYLTNSTTTIDGQVREASNGEAH